MKPLPPLDTKSAFGARPPGLVARLVWRLATARRLPAEWRKRIRKRHARQLPGPFDISVEGLAFRVYPAENHCDRTMLGRDHLPEQPEHALIGPLVRPGLVFVDVGANVGTYAIWVARKAGPDARVLALEPHPRTFAKLAYNIAANGLLAVTALQVGAARETGTMTLHSEGGGNIGTSSMVGVKQGGASHSVAVRPLASLLPEHGYERIDLLKIDVEGFEDRALLPLFDQAPEALWPRAILIETVLQADWQTDCLAFLAKRGYRAAGATTENALLLRD